MHTTAKIVALWISLGTCAYPCAAQQVPALPPTIAAPNDDFSKPPEVPRHRAQVEFSGGKLKVLADNSSLNQILTDVAGQIGMKITGSIPEERVFGIYGPADPSLIVTRLLAGSGSNILLREDARRIPRELILTPRADGPPPPSSGPGDQADTEDRPPQLMPHATESQPQAIAPGAASQPSALPASQPTHQAAAQSETTTEQSPNGVRTPQQIYDQLIQLQQKNAPTVPR